MNPFHSCWRVGIGVLAVVATSWPVAPASAATAAPASTTTRVTPAGAVPNSAFVVDSDNDFVGFGQQLNFDQANSTITTAKTATPGLVYLAVAAPGHNFSAVLAPPAGHNLAPGNYPNAQRALFATAGHPGLDIYGDGRGCNTVSGQFTVEEISYDDQGNLAHFAADAEMHCEGASPAALFASFRLASTVGYSALSFQPSPGPTLAPLALASELLGTTSPAVQVTVTNAGVQPLSISTALTGIYAADYQLTSLSCTTLSPLAPAASCSVSITFTPHGLGERSTSLDFTDSTRRGRHLITLSGTGTAPPTFTYPLNGQARVDTSKQFTWATSPGAQANYLVVGAQPGSADLVNSGVLPATRTSYGVPALPTGTSLYATVFTEINGGWDLYHTITFTAGAQVATFTNPLPGTFADPIVPFYWTIDNQADGYDLVVGTAPGSANLINSGVLPPSQSSYRGPPMPANTVLYATIFTKWAGAWNHYQSISFVYQAPQATLTSPLNGQRVVDMAAPYTWSAVPEAQAYYLVVSTTPGGANLIDSGVLPPTRTYSPGVPLPKGVPLYGTIFTEIAGSWNYFQTITFTAAGPPA